MITMMNVKMLLNGEYSKEDVLDYFRGMYRYHLYYSKAKGLIRTHIREQISFRIKVMDKQCLNQGSCKLCGCMVTALQMANKMCDKPCYPVMQSKEQWKLFKHTGVFEDVKNRIIWRYKGNKLHYFKFKNVKP